MIPIVCTGCNERAEIPFIPPDLTCVACKTGEHIDLDDNLETTAAVDNNGMQTKWGPANPPNVHQGICSKCSQQTDVRWFTNGNGKQEMCKPCVRKANGLSAEAILDDLPMMLLPSGVPDEDRDMPLLTEDGTKRKVVVPKGSAPYSQRALASRLDPKRAGVCSNCHGAGAVPAGGWEDPSEVDNGYVKCPTCYGHGTDAFEEDERLSEKDWHDPMDDPKQELSGWWHESSLTKKADMTAIRSLLAQFNGKNVTITYDDDLGLHTVGGPLTYHPPAVMVGKSATTDVHVLSVTVNGYGDFPDERTEATGSPSPLDYAGIGLGTMASKTAHDVWDERPSTEASCGFEGCKRPQVPGSTMCPQHMGVANPQRTKVAVIADAVQETNPGMDRKAALRIARKTVQRYPKVASGA